MDFNKLSIKLRYNGPNGWEIRAKNDLSIFNMAYSELLRFAIVTQIAIAEMLAGRVSRVPCILIWIQYPNMVSKDMFYSLHCFSLVFPFRWLHSVPTYESVVTH